MSPSKKNRFLLFAGILAVLLLILLRFGLYFLKSDLLRGMGISGLQKPE